VVFNKVAKSSQAFSLTENASYRYQLSDASIFCKRVKKVSLTRTATSTVNTWTVGGTSQSDQHRNINRPCHILTNGNTINANSSLPEKDWIVMISTYEKGLPLSQAVYQTC